LRQGADVQFESLVVLALDLQLGLEFLDQKFQMRNFRAEFEDVLRRCGRALRWGLIGCLRRRGVRTVLGMKGICQGTRPNGIGRFGFRE